jgi:hypothetical protein
VLAVLPAFRLAVALSGTLAPELSERPAFPASKTLAFSLAESLAESLAIGLTCAVPTRAKASRAWLARCRAITLPLAL